MAYADQLEKEVSKLLEENGLLLTALMNIVASARDVMARSDRIRDEQNRPRDEDAQESYEALKATADAADKLLSEKVTPQTEEKS